MDGMQVYKMKETGSAEVTAVSGATINMGHALAHSSRIVYDFVPVSNRKAICPARST
jgi:hypothetical protein